MLRLMERVAKTVALVLVVGGIAVGTSGAAAAGAPSRVVAEPTVIRSATTDEPATNSVCDIWVGGHHGQYICEYGYTHWQWFGWRDHYFVIGLDNAVWNILENPDGSWSGWRSLGGIARSGVYAAGDRYTWLDISVVGADGNWWCKYLRWGGQWQDWRRC